MGYKNLLLLILAFAVIHIQAAPKNSINISLPPGLNPELKTEILNRIQGLSSNFINSTLSSMENLKGTILQKLTSFGASGSLIKIVEQNFECLENKFIEFIRSFLTTIADWMFTLILNSSELMKIITNGISGLPNIVDAINIPNVIFDKLLSFIGFTG